MDTSTPTETPESFAARVLAATGVQLADITVGEEQDILGGTIICRRGQEYVVTYSYPTFTGESYWAIPADSRPAGFEDGQGGAWVGGDAFRRVVVD